MPTGQKEKKIRIEKNQRVKADRTHQLVIQGNHPYHRIRGQIKIRKW